MTRLFSAILEILAPVRSYLLVLLLLCSICGAAVADNERLVRVGIYSGDPATEFSHDLINAIAKKENWKVEYVEGPLDESLQKLRNGDIDLMADLVYTVERDSYADFSLESIHQRWAVVYLPLKSPVKNISDLAGKSVAILDKGRTGDSFLELLGAVNIECDIVRFKSFDEVLKAVESGVAAAGVVNNLFGARFGSDYKVINSTIVFGPSSTFFAVPEGKNGDLVAVADRYLKKWKVDMRSVYYQSLTRWMKGGKPRFSIPVWVYVSFASFAVIVLLLFVWTQLLRRMVNVRTQALQASEMHLRELLEQSPIGLVLCAMDGSFITVNPAYTNIIGFSREEIFSSNYWDMTAEEYAPLEEQRFASLNETGRFGPYDKVVRCKNGSLVPVRIHSMLVERNGERLVWSSVEDIAALKQAETEKEELAEQLRQTQKMEAIGTLAGGVAHDFNNILSAIFGYAELAMREASCDVRVRSNLQSVLLAANRAKNLVRQILMYSRKSENSRHIIEFHAVVLEACNLLQKTLPSSIVFQLDIDSDTGNIQADSTQIHQIVMNLCTNASHALSEQKGEISVSLKPVLLDEKLRFRYPDLPYGEYALLEVADTGIGMSEDVIARIFDPFFTTKKQGEGTGMGLSVVHGIIQSHHGGIRVDTALGEGTTFEVLFPLVFEKATLIKPQGDRSVNLRGSEHILFVDDEAMLVELGKTTLNAFGYQVTACLSSLEAFELFQSNPDIYDLIVTDQTMPELTGDLLAQKAMKIRADIPVIICTGHSKTLDMKKSVTIGVKKLLLKPLDSHTLLREIRDILDAGKMQVRKNSSSESSITQLTGVIQIETSSEMTMDKDVFMGLPEELRDRLQDALNSLNPDKIDAVIADIGRENQTLGRSIQGKAKDFRFDQIKELYKP